jgi:hypothetical protein
LVQLTLGGIWRHNQVTGSEPVSAVAARLTPIRYTAGAVPVEHVRAKLRAASAEVDAGRQWRAKEILQGCLASDAALESEVLEAYGSLLDSLGDRCEAGKYLFLSGQRGPTYSEPIEVFLQRYRRADVTDLIAQFPAQIRRQGLGNLPVVVRNELLALGATQKVLERREPLPHPTQPPGWQDQLFFGGCLLSLLVSLAIFAVGLHTVSTWFF